MNDNIYDLPENVTSTMQGSLGEGDAVKLPFSTAMFWVMNGDARLAQQGGVPYFGGWASDRAEFEAHAKTIGFSIPEALNLMQFTGEDNTYEAYTTRALAVAPIALRRRNASLEPNKFRSHVQLLGLGMIVAKDRVDLGPVVLTAKGYQASNLTNAFKKWEQASAEARREHAKNLDAKFFYNLIGTFGAQPVFDSVGKAQQSKITPVVANIPDEITADQLRGRYVGQQNAARMAEMKEQAKDWLADWKQDKPQDFPTEAPADDILF